MSFSSCPRCKQGSLFSHVIVLRQRCEGCELAFSQFEKGDGAAYIAICVVGFVVTFLAAWVEIAYQPPYWLHAVLWLPMILILSLFCLRYAKAWLIHTEYTSL